MFRRFLRSVSAVLLVLSLLLPSVTMSVSAQSAVTVVRLGGESRVETATTISREGWNNCGTALLANAYSYPDALAGVPLAGALGAPILLTANGDELEEDVRTRLTRMGVHNVYILGGTSVISDGIMNELSDMGFNVDRLYGRSRYSTAVAIAEKLLELTGRTPDRLFFASSANYPDALAAGPAAAAIGCPILYLNPNGSVDEATAGFISGIIEQNPCSAVILGGTSAIDTAAQDSLSALGISEISRISGSDRYATALEINNAFADNLTADSLVAATGTSFPDALAGGAFAAFNSAPILLLPANTGNVGIAEYIAQRNPSSVYILGGTGAVSQEVVEGYFSPGSSGSPSVDTDEEMRGVWIPYISQNDIDSAAIDEMVAECRVMGANAIFFHVRPFGDALYESDYFPWSHLISGSQGTAPSGSFDPLSYMIRTAHSYGIEVHAWINPLRIQLTGGSVPTAVSADNPYTVWRTDDDPSNDDRVIDYNGGKFYNPAYPEVRQLLIDGMVELVKYYDVDGIHWDDYFYPAADESFDDSIAYTAYTEAGGTMTLTEWRTENINTLVRDSYAAVKAADRGCRFGISPQGNFGNCLRIGADVYKWCSTPGYIDYICPQIYWTFSSTAAPFDVRCAEWRSIVTCEDIDLYIGLALYKAAGTADGGKWQVSDTDIADQITYLRGNDVSAEGFILYSYQYLSEKGWEGEVAAVRELLNGSK